MVEAAPAAPPKVSVRDLTVRYGDATALRSVSLAQQTPYKMWCLLDDGTMAPLLELPGVPDCQSQPRQSLPRVYWQNGYVDVLRPRAIFEHGSMWGARVLPFVVDAETYELDYPDDVERVEAALLALTHGDPDARTAPPVRHSV